MEAPVIACPADVTYTTDAGVSTRSNVAWAVGASDNVAIASTTCNATSGSLTAAFGVTPVACTTVDSSGNSASCSFRVTVIGRPCVVTDVPCLSSDAMCFCCQMSSRLRSAVRAM